MVSPPRDVLVIGAGIIGCSVAYELARRGVAVQVVDERPLGMGATQASAGVLAPYIEADEDTPFLELTVRSLAMFDEFVASVSEDGGASVEYHRTGTLDVAADAEQMTALRRAAARLESHGVEFGLLDAQAARSEEPCLAADVAGALLVPAHGFVAAHDLTRLAAAGARRHGAQILEGAQVRRIVVRGDDLVVETNRGPLTARGVVLAAGSWAGRIDIEGIDAPRPVRPVRGQLLHLAWPGPHIRRATWGPRCYLVPWSNGTLLVGATVEEAGFDERTTAAGVRDLLDAVCELTPHAWTAGFIGARVGLRPASGDGLPIVGRSSRVANLYYALGHYRNGILLAPLTAKLLADAMLDHRDDPALQAMNPCRFGRL